MPKWVDRWLVEKSDGSGFWTVSRADDGVTWGCSCPIWKFPKKEKKECRPTPDCPGEKDLKRKECHHIQFIKANPGFPKEKDLKRELFFAKISGSTEAVPALPNVVLARVHQPTINGGSIFIPLVELGNVHQEATICAFMFKHGFSWAKIKEIRRHVPAHWKPFDVLGYVEEHGAAQFTVTKRRRPGPASHSQAVAGGGV